MSMTKEMMEKHNIKEWETDGLAYLLRRIQGAEVGATLRESDEKIRVSLRSFGDVNVAEVAAKLGGGGHVKAAGCSVDAPIIEKATEKVLAAVLKRM